jgi:hypothetical protein
VTKLNFTGRRRIDRSGVGLWMTTAEAGLYVSTDRLNVSGLGLPDDGRIVVEAQHQTNYMRFNCGRVGAILHLDNEPLTEFESPDAILFRVKVIGDGQTDAGKLLAVVDRVRARTGVPGTVSGDEPDSGSTVGTVQLLPFVPRDLEQLTWLLDTSGDRPMILVNRNLPDWKAFVQNPEFRALVLPAALRQIALWVVLENEVDDAGPDDAVWPWKKFLEMLGQSPSGIEEDKAEAWADEVIFAFARRAHLSDTLLTNFDTEDHER